MGKNKIVEWRNHFAAIHIIYNATVLASFVVGIFLAKRVKIRTSAYRLLDTINKLLGCRILANQLALLLGGHKYVSYFNRVGQILLVHNLCEHIVVAINIWTINPANRGLQN